MSQFYIARDDAFGATIEPVGEHSPFREEYHGETYPSREAALAAWINELEDVKCKIAASIRAAKKKQRRWDHRTERRS